MIGEVKFGFVNFNSVRDVLICEVNDMNVLGVNMVVNLMFLIINGGNVVDEMNVLIDVGIDMNVMVDIVDLSFGLIMLGDINESVVVDGIVMFMVFDGIFVGIGGVV